ncbi:hypothetical protein DUNSADRAFT_4609 [Dunaliella salina]|uniref:Encoded protein n=1 Tax=Dunaliella salina TaxID=3046 RepID=A0ABQ7GRP0_DUNSA|nr:hypothetical protein DUNSADRAFT_4609 [Dunaliella salina]|eukprot:KAF5837282.1 hypothetical protein DUNSADRAFT_4609 [Dunaliella salina]
MVIDRIPVAYQLDSHSNEIPCSVEPQKGSTLGPQEHTHQATPGRQLESNRRLHRHETLWHKCPPGMHIFSIKFLVAPLLFHRCMDVHNRQPKVV